jgi:hypothetical protein
VFDTKVAAVTSSSSPAPPPLFFKMILTGNPVFLRFTAALFAFAVVVAFAVPSAPLSTAEVRSSLTSAGFVVAENHLLHESFTHASQPDTVALLPVCVCFWCGRGCGYGWVAVAVCR